MWTMRKTLASATFLLVGAGAAGVGAFDNPTNYRGSDTLFELTKGVIAGCAGATTISYAGSGSGNGASGMRGNTQHTAPMSSFISGAQVCGNASDASNGTEAEGIVIALDGVALTTSPGGVGNQTTCGGLRYSASHNLDVGTTDCSSGGTNRGCVAGAGGHYEYDFGAPVGAGSTRLGFKDLLRVLYFGIHHDASETRDCNSVVRQALVSNYKNLFDSAACTTGSCTGALRHVYRRDDASGTSDVFVGLLSINSKWGLKKLAASGTTQQSNPFCNAPQPVNPGTNWNVTFGYSDFLDADPIRTTCAGSGNAEGDQVCEPDGTLGLVLTIFPPERGPAGTIVNADQYPAVKCDIGEQELAIVEEGFDGNCPNGAPNFGGGCFKGVQRLAGGAYTPNCSQVNLEGQCPFLNPLTATGEVDCRSMNLWMWKRNTTGGSEVISENSTGTSRKYTGAFFREHALRGIAGTTGTPLNCAIEFATDQIGCLAGKADPCSIGFAGREAVAGATPQAIAQKVGGIDLTVANIQHLVDGGSPTYPLARKLFFSSMIGFRTSGGVTGNELTLGKCMADKSRQTAYSTTYGFVDLPILTGALGGKYQAHCQDFAEPGADSTATTPVCPAAATANVNACANNPTGIPKNPALVAPCGDGYLTAPETCDDGNTVDGDGCNATCSGV